MSCLTIALGLSSTASDIVDLIAKRRREKEAHLGRPQDLQTAWENEPEQGQPGSPLDPVPIGVNFHPGGPGAPSHLTFAFLENRSMRCACCTISRVPSASVTASSRRPTAILVWTADPVLRRRRLGSKRVEIASPIGRRRWLLGSFPEGPFGFPVIAIRFPVRSPEVPCYAHQGKALQLVESQERKARKIRFSSAFLEIFPVISRKTGKIRR